MTMTAGDLTLGWLVLQVTDSPFWVGAVAACRGVGTIGFGLFAGVFIDRYDTRRVIILFQGLGGIVLIGLGLLLYLEWVVLWHLLLASLIDGIISSVRAPAQSTLLYQLVGPKRILNANAAKGLGWNIALIAGSPLVGWIIDRFGETFGFFFAAGLSIGATACFFMIRGQYREPTPATAEPIWQSALAGLRYLLSDNQLRRLLTLSVVMEAFGFAHHVMLPVVARNVLGLNATGLGLLSSARGVGSAVSNTIVAALGDIERKSILLVGAAAGAGLFVFLFGLSPWFYLSLGLIFCLGAMLTAYDITMNSLMLMLAGDGWRGRVQSIYTLTYGFVSIGGFVSGTIATAIGAPIALAISGGAILSFVGINMRTLLGVSTEPTKPAAVV